MTLYHILNRHGHSVDGVVLDQGDFEEACIEAIQAGHFNHVTKAVSDFVIDSTGRLYHNGNHIGWIKRDATPTDLIAASDSLGCYLSILTDMRKVTESPNG